jgi:teichuronic acid biosynthesis glycosyltransferase TuaG
MISVIIPTWNRATTIGAAVRSALAQTVRPLEVLVCDDGSTDGSEEAVRAISDPRVRWVPGDRGGRPAIPRNRGIREARGDWLAFLDSDDVWFPEKLERQIGAANVLRCGAVCSNAFRVVPDGGIGGELLAWRSPRVTFGDLVRENQVICSSALVERTLLEKAGGFPEDPQLKAIEDYALWLKIATMTDFAFVGIPLLYYRDDPSSSVRNEHRGESERRKAVYDDFTRWAAGQDVPRRYLGKSRALIREGAGARSGPLRKAIGRLKRAIRS